jgi:hypothetical protein
VKTGRGVRQGGCLSLILFNLYSKYLTNKALEGFGDFRIGQVICTMKYTDNLTLLAKKEIMLQGTIGILTEIGRCNGMEMNVEKAKVMRISRKPSPFQIMIDEKQLVSVGYLNCLSGVITNVATRTCEIKYRNAMAKTAFKRKKTPFTRKLDLNLGKKPMRC